MKKWLKIDQIGFKEQLEALKGLNVYPLSPIAPELKPQFDYRISPGEIFEEDFINGKTKD